MDSYPLATSVSFGTLFPERSRSTRIEDDREWEKAETEAQRWWDMGMAQCYNFNRPESVQCFQEALKLSSSLSSSFSCNRAVALCKYGIAYASGVDYNKPIYISENEAKRAFDNVREAVRLSEEVDWPAEKDKVYPALFRALRKRVVWPPPKHSKDYAVLNRAYATEMGYVYDAYGSSCAEVPAMYAEALMQLRPWNLWEKTKKTTTERKVSDEHDNDDAAAAAADDDDEGIDPETQEIKRTLERALEKWPTHPGLCHLYIHLMEMSDEPARALPQCDVLRKNWSDFGHLAHMPSHIDVQVGKYGDAAEANRLGIASDLKMMRYREKTFASESFYFGYLAHNYHMYSWAAMFDGQYATAIKSARELVEITPEATIRAWAPDLENYMAIKWHVLIRFGRWDTILAEPLKLDRDLYPVCIATGLYAKGIACSALGRVSKAAEFESRFTAAVRRVPPDAVLHNVLSRSSLKVAACMLRGELKFRLGELEESFEALRKAVELEDNLPYDEPWGWMVPARHALGALLLESGRVEEAKNVFDADLLRYPNNLWALTGLRSCAALAKKRAPAGGCCASTVDDDDDDDDEMIADLRRRLLTATKRSDVDVHAACYCAGGDTARSRGASASNDALLHGAKYTEGRSADEIRSHPPSGGSKRKRGL